MSMDKYGVVTDLSEPMEKTAKSSAGITCPRCGAKAAMYSGVLVCPSCGTAPFETETRKKDTHDPSDKK